MSGQPPVLAVDLGGTNMRAALVNADGRIVARGSVDTPRERPCGKPLVKLTEAVRGNHPVDHAVFALPGRVDYVAGTLEHAPNLPPAWIPELRADRFDRELGVPVQLANDADIAAVGEAYFGAGRGARDLVYLTVSTGVGAGVLIDRRVLTPGRSAAEIGHTVIERAALAGGQPATVEDLGSGNAIARMSESAGVTARGADFVGVVEAGDAAATRIWRDAMEVVGLAAVNLAHLFAPRVIVIGGGVGRNGELVLEPVREALARFGPDDAACPEVRTAALGDDPGLIGAAAWRRAVGARPA